MEDFDGRISDAKVDVARKILGKWQVKVTIEILEDPTYWNKADEVIAMLTEARARMVAAGVVDPILDFEHTCDDRWGSTTTLNMRGWRRATREEIARAKRVEVTHQRERERALREQLARLEAEIAQTKSNLSEEES